MNPIYINLYEKRTEKGLSLSKLSQLSGVSKGALNMIENGKVSPRISTLQCIAVALDCKVKDLIVE